MLNGMIMLCSPVLGPLFNWRWGELAAIAVVVAGSLRKVIPDTRLIGHGLGPICCAPWLGRLFQAIADSIVSSPVFPGWAEGEEFRRHLMCRRPFPPPDGHNS
jgi:hypothetical protein